MIHNPLLLKEFRQRMRTVRAPIVVTGYFVGMALITFFLLYENVQGQLSLFLPARSEQVFVTLSLLQTIVAAFLTPALRRIHQSGERERRTLAVLLTTPLPPGGILLGKVLSSSALLTLLLVVTLPLYSLVFLFGGAVPQEVIAVFAFRLFTVVLIAAISVMWSTISLNPVEHCTLVRNGDLDGVRDRRTRIRVTHDCTAVPHGVLRVRVGGRAIKPESFVDFACIENPGLGRPLGWLWFVGVYVGFCLLLTIPSVWRLRPQAFRFVPGALRAGKRLSIVSKGGCPVSGNTAVVGFSVALLALIIIWLWLNVMLIRRMRTKKAQATPVTDLEQTPERCRHLNRADACRGQ